MRCRILAVITIATWWLAITIEACTGWNPLQSAHDPAALGAMLFLASLPIIGAGIFESIEAP